MQIILWLLHQYDTLSSSTIFVYEHISAIFYYYGLPWSEASDGGKNPGWRRPSPRPDVAVQQTGVGSAAAASADVAASEPG